VYQFKGSDDTIAAIATPLGTGGIGIVRLSGKDALRIADGMFLAKNKGRPSWYESRTLHYGWVLRRGTKDEEIIDEVLVTVMRAPRSYTREDVVEFSCHGGIVSAKAILQIALDGGARLAEPGEFTKRAFLNGRLDLTQAEAVLDIIRANTDAFLRVGVSQLKGDLSRELKRIREHLLGIYTEIEDFVNFPEDDIDASGRKLIQEKIGIALLDVEKLIASGEQGRILKEGIKIVLCGKANVGKSALLNVLLKQPRAIVSEIAGTTRDTIEESARIRGIPFQLVDTAGILEPRDLIEQEAVQRSRMSIQGADLALLILDGSDVLSTQDEAMMELLQGRNLLVVLNKCDLPVRIDEKQLQEIFGPRSVVRISATRRVAIERLEEAIVEKTLSGKGMEAGGLLISNLRQLQSLKECAAALRRAGETVNRNQSLEFVSEDIKNGINELDAITGRNIDADLLDKIFSEFCIGK